MVLLCIYLVHFVYRRLPVPLEKALLAGSGLLVRLLGGGRLADEQAALGEDGVEFGEQELLRFFMHY